jgi:hypothetical protein
MFCQDGGGAWWHNVSHVSKCKNDKIKDKKNKNKVCSDKVLSS